MDGEGELAALGLGAKAAFCIRARRRSDPVKLARGLLAVAMRAALRWSRRRPPWFTKPCTTAFVSRRAKEMSCARHAGAGQWL